jgi:ADP-heptose:LPS heptosyltransferase
LRWRQLADPLVRLRALELAKEALDVWKRHGPYFPLGRQRRAVVDEDDLNVEDDDVIFTLRKQGGSAKEWGLDNFCSLIKALPQGEFKIFITGLQEEGEIIQRESPELFEDPNVVNLRENVPVCVPQRT